MRGTYESETTEGNVDDGVSGADAALDPDGERGEEDSEQSEETVGRTHESCRAEVQYGDLCLGVGMRCAVVVRQFDCSYRLIAEKAVNLRAAWICVEMFETDEEIRSGLTQQEAVVW
jgi:hypothetical protein